MFLIKVILFITLILWASGYQLGRIDANVNEIPDTNKRTVDFIVKYNYPGEMHEIRTEDNYFLTLFRIPHNGSIAEADRPVVLLQHGVILSSDQWVLRGGTEDLVFLLSNQGYDVWMSNSRGTPYSRHSTYGKSDYEFWNYSLTELANFDLRAIIDYILTITNKPHLSYIGHSRGVAMAIILLSSRPEYNSKINLFLGIAPVIYSREAKCPIFELVGNRPNALMKVSALQKFLEMSRIPNVFYTTKNMRTTLNMFCRPKGLLENLCPYIIFFVNGEDFQMFNKTIFPLMISHFTMGMASKELIHLLQISDSDNFQPFDYGKEKNIMLYGSEKPKPFNLSKILVPTYLYYGPNDLFVSERDLLKFAGQLRNLQGYYKVPYRKFNHLDYIFARNANDLLYPHIISVLNKYNL